MNLSGVAADHSARHPVRFSSTVHARIRRGGGTQRQKEGERYKEKRSVRERKREGERDKIQRGVREREREREREEGESYKIKRSVRRREEERDLSTEHTKKTF